MTRNLSDLLVVYLLAREAGLAVNPPHGLVCRCPWCRCLKPWTTCSAARTFYVPFWNIL
jgi:hypothetical protein